MNTAGFWLIVLGSSATLFVIIQSLMGHLDAMDEKEKGAENDEKAEW
jgi:hypothetical protein